MTLSNWPFGVSVELVITTLHLQSAQTSWSHLGVPTVGDIFKRTLSTRRSGSNGLNLWKQTSALSDYVVLTHSPTAVYSSSRRYPKRCE